MGALAAWAPTIITVLTAIFVAGQITGRIKSQEIVIKDHHDRLNEHDGRLGSHDIAIAKSEAWRAGYSAGTDYSNHGKPRQ